MKNVLVRLMCRLLRRHCWILQMDHGRIWLRCETCQQETVGWR